MPVSEMVIRFSKQFRSRYDAADPKIKAAVSRRLKLFRSDPQAAQLKNHALKGTFKGLRSINITGDWRAVYVETHDARTGKVTVTFQVLGTHSQLYR